MRYIDQLRMLGLCQIDIGSRRFGAHRLEAHSHDFQSLGMEFGAKGLPPGQVIGAASIG